MRVRRLVKAVLYALAEQQFGTFARRFPFYLDHRYGCEVKP